MQTGSGSVQLTKQSPYLTDLSLRTLGLLFNVPDTAQNATRLDLPALLNQLAHTSLYSAVPKGSDRRMWFGPGPLVACIFFLQQHTGPKQQLLEQLELHTMHVVVLSVLDWLESPHFATQPAFLDHSGPVFEVATSSYALQQLGLLFEEMLAFWSIINNSCNQSIFSTLWVFLCCFCA